MQYSYKDLQNFCNKRRIETPSLLELDSKYNTVHTFLSELKAYYFLLDAGYTVTDLRSDEESRLNDIDFLVSKDGYSFTVEVKGDSEMARTNNFYIEYCHYRPYKTERENGWYHYCKADYIMYVDSTQDKVYFLKWSEMKPKINTEYFSLKTTANKIDIGTKTTGFLVPVNEAISYGFIAYNTALDLI